MHLRQFTESGINEFRRFLQTCRDNPAEPLPCELLENDEHTEIVEPRIELEERSFVTKRDAAEFFHARFAGLRVEFLTRNSGLWTWLSVLYFDSLCPVVKGKRTIRNDYTYVFFPNSMRDFYRHLLFASWNARHVSPRFNRLFLYSKISQMDKYNVEVFKRLYLTRVPCIFEVVDRLYWDEKTDRPIKGMVDSQNARPGDLTHRLPIRIRQLERTYDLHSLSADQLIELLGDEFQQKERRLT